MKRLLSLVFVISGVALHAATLFSNGIADGNAAFVSCMDCREAPIHIYDDFAVPVGGWTVQGIEATWIGLQSFGDVAAVSAHWEIRQGVAQGNSGTLIASGTTALNWSHTAGLGTYYTAPGFYFYKGSVTIPDVHLAAGTYWVAVSPYTSGTDIFLMDTTATSGGTNALPDNESFVTGPYWSGMQNIPAYVDDPSRPYDYTYVVNGFEAGAAAPEPGTAALVLVPAAAAWILRRRV